MKSAGLFEDALLDSGEIMKRAARGAIYNMGKIIAIFTLLITVAVTFTDISFSYELTEELISSVLLLLTSSYIIYFSLVDAGEKYGMESEEYRRAAKDYGNIRAQIRGDMIEDLRGFCAEYAENEMKFRKKAALLSAALSEEELLRYNSGERFCGRIRRTLAKISSIKPMILTPALLLGTERASTRSELESPERRKLPMLVIKLIPSTVCMLVTLSVMLTAKDEMTSADVLNGILKLSALPLIGFRGYASGYSYAKHSLADWLKTKTDILESFINKKEEK